MTAIRITLGDTHGSVWRRLPNGDWETVSVESVEAAVRIGIVLERLGIQVDVLKGKE